MRSLADLQAKSQAVVAHHYDETKPGKPLYLLIPGALIAAGALVLGVMLLWRLIVQHAIEATAARPLLIILLATYIGGVFLFSYGYELFDVNAALKLTAEIVVLTVLVVVMIAALFFVIAAMFGDREGKSESSSSKSSFAAALSDRAAPAASTDPAVGQAAASQPYRYSPPAGQPYPYSRHQSYGSTINLFGVSTGPTYAPQPIAAPAPPATAPVAAARAPSGPPTLTCPYCHNVYTAASGEFACPKCGAPNDPRTAAGSAAGPAGAITAGELRGLGLQPEWDQPQVKDDETGQVISYTSKSGADGGIEIGIHDYGNDAEDVLTLELMEQRADKQVSLSGADAAWVDVSGKLPAAVLVFRRQSKIFDVHVPSNGQAARQLAAIAALLVQRVQAKAA